MFIPTFQFGRHGRALQKDERGQTTMEFALTALLVFTVIFGTLEFCSLMYTYATLAEAANSGLRYLAVNSSDQAGAISAVTNSAKLSFHDTSAIKVTVSCTTYSCAPGGTATIAVTYAYIPYLPAFIKHPPTLKAFAEGVTVN